MLELEKRTLDLFKMLGNSTRYIIISSLSRGELNVSQITRITGKNISTVSKHLRLLKELEIVGFRTAENKVIYNLKKKGIMALIDNAKRVMNRES